jgi:tRNA(Ile)-lysidine synthase
MTLHPLEYDTLMTLGAGDLLPRGSRVVVGVSGGADSLALLLVLAALREELLLEVTAVYVDHGLRPGEAAAEAGLVAAVAAGLGVAFSRGAVVVRTYAEEHGLSLEEAGRVLRYRFLREVAGEQGRALIAVAHHADDQAEELLLRLIRGSGRAGLSGMRVENDRGVIRPFLNFPKARLTDYLRERRVDWREDSSNTDPRFLRNRVRLELLPLLEKRFNPAIRAGLVRTGRILGAEDELLAGLAEEFFREILVGPASVEGLALDAARLTAGHPALQRRALELALLELAAPVRFRYIEDLRQLASGRGGELHLAEGLRVVKAAGFLRFAYPAGRVRQRGDLLGPGMVPFSMAIAAPGLWAVAPPVGSLLVEVLDQPPSEAELKGGGCDYLDVALVTFPLLARSVHPGDRFHPLGAPGCRKVADFLGDRKLPAAERARLVVLESAGRIVALVGQRIDHSCRLTGTTVKVLKVRLGS